jgi:hypothetical protein
LRGEGHPARLHAVEADRPLAHGVGAGQDVILVCFRLEHRMVEHRGEFERRHGGFVPMPSRARAMRAAR